MIFDDATRAQIAAADPTASTWLSANAGSGKTRVLTDRVARLLLNGTQPQRILCLTYTKAAASEMQNRLFKRLGDWAMMDDATLQKNLLELGASPDEAHPDALARARSLFATAIETPGGLKIQTIHSFCSSVLRRFPLEANISPGFTEMDERTGKILRQEALEDVAEKAPAVMAEFALHFTGAEVDNLLTQITQRMQDFATPLDEVALARSLGIKTTTTEQELVSSVFLGGEMDMLRRVAEVLVTHGEKTDLTLGQGLKGLAGRTPSLDILPTLETLFLTGKGAKIPFAPKASPPTKKMQPHIGADLSQLDQLRHRVADARDVRLALLAREKTRVLHRFAAEFLPRISRFKAQRGWLDFDDLIFRTRELLTAPRVASWVLYRLDGGIDHVLVDEAQDTSPAQWDVIKLLTKEFFSGEGARSDQQRTIFVVGDQKQSIYSFQGADPAQFDENQVYFAQELQEIGDRLAQQDLLYSFRSASPILQLVDASFTEEFRAGMGAQITHKAFKEKLPGRVDLWPWIDGKTTEETRWDIPWYQPVDTVSEDHHTVQLARQIAAFISDRLANGQIEDSNGVRPIEPGDFLILVQGRQQLFREIISACKTANLEIAGADMLRVGAELGVKDLTALLKVLATPEDDLSLSAVLKSPLFGWSEAQLFDLAHGRGRKTLRQVLEDRKEEFPTVHATLTDLRNTADFLRPYELLERILTNHNGREKLLARLGQEAEDGLRALLDLALQYETSEVPSLTGFLTWLEADEVKIKRQIDSSNNQIRVMTVHGAKGLEAPIVILPDTGGKKSDLRNELFDTEGGLMWANKTDDRPDVQRRTAGTLKQKSREEKMRLLYVAMTRAENWLILCGAGAEPKLDNGDWYAVVEAGMQSEGAVETDAGLRLENTPFPPDRTNQTCKAPAAGPLPDWIASAPPTPSAREISISPSNLGGAKALPSEHALDEEQAKERGTAIHLLLEKLPELPEAQWEEAADHLIGAKEIAGSPPPFQVAKCVLKAPHLSEVFAQNALADVAITGRIPALGETPISGVIDRLIITETNVTSIDFKSNQEVPTSAKDIPEGVLRQIGAYHALLEQIYPDHLIELAILWTANCELMVIPHDIVRNALLRAHIS